MRKWIFYFMVMGYSPFAHFLFTYSFLILSLIYLALISPTSQSHCWLGPQPGDISDIFACVGFELKTARERVSCRLTLGALGELCLEHFRKGTNFEIHMCAMSALKFLFPFHLDLNSKKYILYHVLLYTNINVMETI